MWDPFAYYNLYEHLEDIRLQAKHLRFIITSSLPNSSLRIDTILNPLLKGRNLSLREDDSKNRASSMFLIYAT